VAQQFGKIVEANVKLVNKTGLISGITDKLQQNNNPLNDYGVHVIRHLLASGLSVSDVTWTQIVPTGVSAVANQAQNVGIPLSSHAILLTEEQFAQLMDYYLGPGQEHLAEINRLAKVDNAETDDKLLHYVMEGIRIAGTFGCYRLANDDVTVEDAGKTLHIKKGDKVFVSIVSHKILS
jgi:linoleate 10R-lipoxygenase